MMAKAASEVRNGTFVGWSSERPSYEVGQLMHCIFDLNGEFTDSGYAVRSIEQTSDGWKMTAVKWDGYPDNIEWRLGEGEIPAPCFADGGQIDMETWPLIYKQIEAKFKRESNDRA